MVVRNIVGRHLFHHLAKTSIPISTPFPNKNSYYFFTTSASSHHRDFISLCSLFQRYGFPPSKLPDFLKKNEFLLDSSPSEIEKSFKLLLSLKPSQEFLVSTVSRCPRVLELEFLEKWQFGVSNLDICYITSTAIMNVLEISRKFELCPDDVSNTVKCLKGLGFRDSTITRVLETMPMVIVSTGDKIRGKIEFLMGIGILRREIDRFFSLFPGILAFGVEDRLKPLLDEFRDLGLPLCEVKREILRDPVVLGLENGELSQCLEMLRNLKCRVGIKQDILRKGEFRAGYEVKLRIDCLRKHGLIYRDAFTVVRKEPRVILYEIDDIEKKIDFLVSKMKLDVECLVQVPEFLGVNFDKQIVPRFNVIEYLRSSDGLGDEVSLRDMVRLSRLRFYNMYVKPYPECEKMYGRFAGDDVGLWKVLKPPQHTKSGEDVKNIKSYLPKKQDPHSLLKEDPIQVLSDLWVKSFSQTQKPFLNLTGFLSKLDLWVLAYQRACAHATGSFPPKNSIPSHALSSLLSLRNAVVRNQFQWDSKVEQLIRTPNDKSINHELSKRKLQSILASGAVPFQDRVVQEVLLMILEPIFEARFSAKSHGFRPGRNPHTVIRTIRSNFAGYLWFIRGDLSELLHNVDLDIVMSCVEKSVKDKKVLNLIKSGLKVSAKNQIHVEEKGMNLTKEKRKKGQTRKRFLSENEPKPDPYWLRTFFDFSPEEAAKVPDYGFCGILSPLLMNVCLHELDHMFENKILEFFKPSASDSIWKYSINDGCHNPSWPEFVPSSGKEKTRKMDYIRFGGHFLIGIRGPREEAVGIRKEIIEFCERQYGIRLDNSRVEIEHITRGIHFLDHIICRRVIHPTLRYTSSSGKIVSEKGIGTLLSVTASLQQCIRQFRRIALLKGDRDPEPLPCTPMLYSGQAHTNSQMNKLLETMADWYRYADNRKKIVGFCAYVIRSSLAARYRLKSRAKVYKIASRNLSRPLRELLVTILHLSILIF